MKLVQSIAFGIVAIALSTGVFAQDVEITYNEHVGRIINENCVVCHREGGIGPMQFGHPWAQGSSWNTKGDHTGDHTGE